MSTNLDRGLHLQTEAIDNIESSQNTPALQREAIELNSTGHSAQDGVSPSRTERTDRSTASKGRVHGISVFWKRQISVVVSHDDCRDHFGTAPKDICQSHSTSVGSLHGLGPSHPDRKVLFGLSTEIENDY